MEKQRSIGVTIFGWLFIIFGTFGIIIVPIGMYTDRILPPPHDLGTPIYYFDNTLSFIFSICGLISGLFILKLRNWARRLAIILRLIGIALLIIYIPLDKGYTKHFETGTDALYMQERQTILKYYKLEDQRGALEKIEKRRLVSKINFNILYIILLVFTVGYKVIIIYFFTHPKVKEQFKSGVKM